MSSKVQRSRKNRSKSTLPPETLLRPRLDAWWHDDRWLQRADEDLSADLDVLLRGVRPQMFLGALLKAYQGAGPLPQKRLDEFLPAWLRDHGLFSLLQEGIARGSFTGPDHVLAQRWAGATGVELVVPAVALQADPFFRGYYYGDGSQAVVFILWYRDRNRTSVQGFNFLIDHNPPWEGAVKDIIAFPSRDPRTAIREWITSWESRGQMPLQQVSAAEARRRVIEALDCNRRHNIRLPADLIAQRERFLRHVLTLPAGDDEPAFTAADFDALSQVGERPEAIMHFEKTVGRRVRMDDGKELLIMGADRDWDDDF